MVGFLKNGVESKMNVWENLNRQIDRQIDRYLCDVVPSFLIVPRFII